LALHAIGIFTVDMRKAPHGRWLRRLFPHGAMGLSMGAGLAYALLASGSMDSLLALHSSAEAGAVFVCSLAALFTVGASLSGMIFLLMEEPHPDGS